MTVIFGLYFFFFCKLLGFSQNVWFVVSVLLCVYKKGTKKETKRGIF